ncbi:MAG TPA: M3 family metallopeptidase, partial [Bdellovibrionota bacterium]|nr:M3 family metallopeptidase [Bdellovibrionota bacterium]
MAHLNDLNERYFRVHQAKEDAFWSSKMGLPDGSPERLERTEVEWKNFISNVDELKHVRAELDRPGLNQDDRLGLEGWKLFFETNVVESAEAKKLQAELTERETRLQKAREDMSLGYDDPATGGFKEASMNELSLLVSTSKDEATRKAAWLGMRSVEPVVLQNGFLEVVRERNRLARLLGYADYYEYKVQTNERFSKKQLFQVLDELLRDTEKACAASMADLESKKGPGATKPWNLNFNTAGDLTERLDPYYPFAESLGRWGQSFSALGIRYRGASLVLDLLDRKGKYANGFMHGPEPGYLEAGKWRPARIQFTANAVLGRVGAGHTGLTTFFHEGGHAAHYSNITMPAPCFSQEFAPSS